jgi:hypothetical protein
MLRIFYHFGQEKTVAAIKNDMPNAKSWLNHGLHFMYFSCMYLLLWRSIKYKFNVHYSADWQFLCIGWILLLWLCRQY